MLLYFLWSYMVSRSWELFTYSEIKRNDLIVFRVVPMYESTFYFMLLAVVSNLIMVSAFYFMAQRYMLAMHILFGLYCIDVLDFWLFYGDNLFKVYEFAFGYSFIKGIFMVAIFSIILMNEICIAVRK